MMKPLIPCTQKSLVTPSNPLNPILPNRTRHGRKPSTVSIHPLLNLRRQKKLNENPLSAEQGIAKEEAERFQTQLQKLLIAANFNHGYLSTLLAQEHPPEPEKIPTNLNALCAQCFDLVYQGLKPTDETTNITVSKDLEKNLPQIKLFPNAVSQLLMNVLINAFEAVEDKRQKDTKGYLPKVTISTRVLPR